MNSDVERYSHQTFNFRSVLKSLPVEDRERERNREKEKRVGEAKNTLCVLKNSLEDRELKLNETAVLGAYGRTCTLTHEESLECFIP
jgi:hypothetical protein